MIDTGEHIHVTPSDAAAELTRQITAKYGADPDVLDRLTMISRKLPLGQTGRTVQATIAFPTGERVTESNVCAVASGIFDKRHA
jgi:hypothetical protein